MDFNTAANELSKKYEVLEVNDEIIIFEDFQICKTEENENVILFCEHLNKLNSIKAFLIVYDIFDGDILICEDELDLAQFEYNWYSIALICSIVFFVSVSGIAYYQQDLILMQQAGIVAITITLVKALEEIMKGVKNAFRLH